MLQMLVSLRKHGQEESRLPIEEEEVTVFKVYTIVVLLCDLGVGRQTEKRGVPRWWCILFFA